MPLLKFKDETGNALVEFIAFGLLVLAPISVFTVEQSRVWVIKAQAESAATQLARAASLGPTHFESLTRALRAKTPVMQVQLSSTDCCVSVQVELEGQFATARQVK